MEQTQTGTNITTLPPAARAVIVLDSAKAEKELRELVAKSAGIVSVIDPAGREEAHRAGMTLKNARIAIEKTGKAARDDANQFSKAVVAEEKRLIAIITPEEERVFAERDAYDAKVKAEKEAAERKEQARVQGIKAQIAGILNLPAHSYRDSAAQIQETLDDLAALEITEARFAEFAGDAAEAKATALLGMNELLIVARATEAEAARIEAERAELQRLQAAEIERRKAAEAAEAETKRKLEAALAELEKHRAAAEKPAPEIVHHKDGDHFGGFVTFDQVLAEARATREPAPAEQAEPAEVSETLTAAVVPFETDFAEPDVDADLKDGIAILCAAVEALRTMGMSSEQILVTVGEALEAIDAKEAA